MNKGKVLRLCKECGKKKFCTKVRIPGHNYRFECNKGHTWTIQGITAERVQAAIEDILLPKIKDIFERDNVFYTTLRKK